MHLTLLSNDLVHGEPSRAAMRAQRLNDEAYFEQFARLGFDSAKTSRLHSVYRRTVGSADSVLDIDREKLVGFSRQMYDNSVPFRGFTERFIDLVIGTGLTPRGINPSARRAVDLFTRWCNRKALCDHRGRMNFWQMQRQAMRELILAGDIPVVKTKDGALQMLEAEQVRDPYGQKLDDGTVLDMERLRDGVEVDEFDRIVRIWFSEYGRWGGALDYRVRAIPIEQVMFLAYRTRSSQTRGVPMWAPALERFAMFEDYLDAVGVSANLAARLALIIKTMQGTSHKDLTAAMGGASTKSRGETQTPGEANLLSIDTGSIFHLKAGEDVETVQGAQPSTAFESYSRAVLSMLAAMAGAPLEVIMLDNSRVNYSTSRMAEYQARNAAEPFREILGSDLLDPAYEFWRARAILSGTLDDDPMHASDFIQWNSPARWSIDPGREYEAENKAVQFNFKTRDQVIREMDQDPDEVVRGRAAEITRDRELGITPPLMPGQEQPGGQVASDASGRTDGEPDDAVAENLSKGEKLNGAQITAAIEILRQLKLGDLTIFQAIELLTAVGIDPEKAQQIAEDTQTAAQDS